MQALSQLSYSPTGPSREYYNSFGKGVNWGGYAPAVSEVWRRQVAQSAAGLERGGFRGAFAGRPYRGQTPPNEVGLATRRFSWFLTGASGDSTARGPPQLLLLSRGRAGRAPRLSHSARTRSMALHTGCVPRWR